MSTRNPLEVLREKLANLHRDAAAIEAAAQAAGRVEFTDDEQTQLNALHAQFEATEKQIAIHERNLAIEASLAQPQPRKTEPQPVNPSPRPALSITGGTPASANFQNHGFTRGLSEFMTAVKMASYGKIDQRLMNAVTTYGGEATTGGGTDGGFAVPPQFAASITEIVMGEDSLVSKFNPIITSSNQVVLPTDETTPYGTSGIYAEWLGEGGAMTARKPALKQVNVPLHKVGALVYISEELQSDAPAIQSHISRKMAKAIVAKVNDSLLAGDGLAKPLGLKNAPALVTVTKSTSTFVAVDAANMLSRMLPEAVASSFWIVHNTVLPYIWTMTLGQVPVYVNDMRASPYGSLLGRPLYVSEFCQDYNTAGDIFLVSPDGYACAIKSGGIETAASIHFAFDQNLQAFRAVMRIGGTPLATAATARKNGSNTLSHIVCMGVRS